MASPGFLWTDEHGVPRILGLLRPIVQRGGSRTHARRSYRSISLDQTTITTEEMEGGAELMTADLRFVGAKTGLLDLLKAGRAGTELTYRPDLALAYDEYPCVMESAGDIVGMTPDPQRYGFDEWSATVTLRRIDGGDWTLWSHSGIQHILQGVLEATPIRGGFAERVDAFGDVNEAFLTVQVVDTSGPTWTDLTTEASNAVTDDVEIFPGGGLFELYMGMNTYFSQATFLMTDVAAASIMSWQYWDGTSWELLSNLVDGTDGFTVSGWNTVRWSVPADWQPNSVNGITRFWVRVVSGGSSDILTASQIRVSRMLDVYFGGAVAAPNGKVFGIPIDGGAVLVIDTNVGTYTLDYSAQSFLTPTGWIGGVLLSGRVWGIPFNASDVIVIDVETGEITVDDFDGAFSSAGGEWYGGVVGSDGKIYCVPHNADDVLVIDVEEHTATRETFGLSLSGSQKWAGGVLAPNGKIYCIPYQATEILVIDTIEGTATLEDFGYSGGFTGSTKWIGGVLGPDGKVYGIPYNSTTILIIDPVAEEVTLSNMFVSLAGTEKWLGGVLGPDGRIYGIPFNHSQFLVIDTDRESADLTDLSESNLGGNWKWHSGVLATDGRIYGMPYFAEDVLVITARGAGFPVSVITSPHLDKL